MGWQGLMYCRSHCQYTRNAQRYLLSTAGSLNSIHSITSQHNTAQLLVTAADLHHPISHHLLPAVTPTTVVGASKHRQYVPWLCTSQLQWSQVLLTRAPLPKPKNLEVRWPQRLQLDDSCHVSVGSPEQPVLHYSSAEHQNTLR